jgi:proteasome lid subunit RPN8/RPN11
MHFAREIIDAIFKQAAAEYPSECCGIVTGTSEHQRLHPLINIQEKLHADDPETHPRTSRNAYAVNRNELERVLADAASKGESVLAFYHSHIDCDAYFSLMDKEVQTVFGEPEYPSAVQVVVAVKEKKVCGIKGYLWDRKKQDFVQVEVS